MIRILYVSDLLVAGGVEAQLTALATRIDRNQFDPHLIYLYGSAARDPHFGPELRAAHIPFHALDLAYSPTGKLKGVMQIIRYAWALRPQIIHVENYHANLLTKLARPFLPATSLIGSIRGVYTPKQLLYERSSHFLCKYIVTNAEHMKTSLELAGVPRGKVLHIPNGVDVQRFATPHDLQLSARVRAGARLVFVTIGRISAEKNIHLIVEAFGIVKHRGSLPPDVHLLIVGPVQELDQQALIDQAVHDSELEGIVHQYPATTYPEDFLHTGDISILFSPAEGLSNVMLESLAAGRPVIISKTANAAGVIGNSQTGWIIESYDPRDLADAVCTAITLPETEISRMRTMCRQTAQKYSMEVMVDEYSRLYESVAGNHTFEPKH